MGVMIHEVEARDICPTQRIVTNQTKVTKQIKGMDENVTIKNQKKENENSKMIQGL